MRLLVLPTGTFPLISSEQDLKNAQSMEGSREKEPEGSSFNPRAQQVNIK